MKPFSSRPRLLAAAIPLAGFCCYGCFDFDADNNGIHGANNRAMAEVSGYTDSTLQGTLHFEDEGDSLFVSGTIAGFAPGSLHGIHVHQFGNCEAPDSSGEHFGAPIESHGNPSDTPDRHHRGDLPNLVVDSLGVGHIEFRTETMTLGNGSRSALNRSIVVHADTDDYVTQPDGGSGAKVGCGVIR